MSVYSERLAVLKKDIARIRGEKKSRKNKKFNINEKIMIDFINFGRLTLLGLLLF